jgi:PPOX class probable F420-dependent enzyme
VIRWDPPGTLSAGWPCDPIDWVTPSLDSMLGDTVSVWPGRVDAVNELDRARYISLTTFKMDGSPVSSPVWITGAAGTYVFTTGDKAWKTRRLLRNSSVRVQVCDMRGRVKPPAARYVGTGEVASSADAVAAAEQALAAKYGWQFRATKLVDGLKGRLGRGERQEPVAVHLSLSKG